MKKTEPLNQKAIEQIAKLKLKENRYVFDLSRVSVDVFESLMKSVNGSLLLNSGGIGFNCDLLVKTDRKNEQMMADNPRSNKAPVYPLALQNSAAKRKKDFTKILAKTVSTALERTESMSFLKFRFIPLKYPEIEMLSAAIFANNTLRVLRFCEVPLGDKGLSRLCRALRKRSIQEVQFRKCNLTDACTYDLRSLLAFHVFVQSEEQWRDSVMGTATETVCLQSLDLRDNEFTYQFIDIIQDSILDVPLRLLDLRGNAGLTANIVKPLQEKVPRTRILTGLSPLPKCKQPTYVMDEIPQEKKQPPKQVSARARRIQQLEEENQRLHALIEELQMGVNVAQLEPDLMIVGPRASEFVEQVSQLDLLLAKSEHGPAPFLESTRRKISDDVRKMITSKKKPYGQVTPPVPKKKKTRTGSTKSKATSDRSSSPRRF